MSSTPTVRRRAPLVQAQKAIGTAYHWWPTVVRALCTSIWPDSIRATRHILAARRTNDVAIVVGNGPTAAEDLRRVTERYPGADVFTVNSLPTTPVFRQYHPRFHVFIDTFWWSGNFSGRRSVCGETLRAIQSDVDWPLTIVTLRPGVPFLRRTLTNPNVAVVGYRGLEAVGMSPQLAVPLHRRLLLMPVGQTVLLHAAFWPLVTGYSKVLLIGAGHEYPEYRVDQRTNAVTWLDKHFYDHVDVPLSWPLAGEILAWGECFRQWSILAGLARARGVEFKNASGHSMIDSIPREAP